MRNGYFVPYGSVLLPVGAVVIAIDSLLTLFGGSYHLWFQLAWSLIFGLGFVEAITGYYFIADARASSVKWARNTMRVGLFFLAFSVAMAIIPSLTARAFSIELPFPSAIEWIGLGALLVGAFPCGGVSLVVWERWSSSYPEDLEIPYWSKLSRSEWVRLSGVFTMLIAFSLNFRVATVALTFFGLGGVLFVVGTVLGKNPRTEPVSATMTPPKVELRRADYQERLAIGKRACEFILRKYGRRVYAVCMWGDEKENSEFPNSGVRLFVVVRDGVRLAGQHYVFKGVRVKIDYWPELGILHRAKTFDENWAWYSGSYRTRLVLYQRKDWLRKLDNSVRQSDAADATEAIRESALDLAGHLTDVRDDQLRGDEVGVRTDCWYAASTAMQLIFLLNRTYMKSDYWAEVFECREQPRNLRHRLEVLQGLVTASQPELVECAETLSEELLESVRSRGIDISSSQLKV